MVFVEWALNNGCGEQTELRRHDKRKNHSPTNSYFVTPTGEFKGSKIDDGWAALWNKTVNRIRVHYGMEPFEVEP